MLDRVFEFPGLFPAGSAADEALKAKWRNKKSDFGFKIKGDIVDFGIIPDRWEDLDRAAVSTGHLGNEALTQHYDNETLALIDFRIRWCRCYLDEAGFPYDREDIYVDWEDPSGAPSWAYVNDVMSPADDLERTDPLDFLKLLNFAMSGPSYAGKILLHFRRADRFLDKEALTPLDAIGLAREMMLIGETWSEAKFVINHARATISGARYMKKSEEGAASRRGSYADHTEAVIAEMQRLIVEGRTVSNAARITAKKGVGTSEAANRRLWYDHIKKDVRYP